MFESILQIALTLVPGIAAAIWAWFKRKDYVNESVEKALEVGVSKAWTTFGKERKTELAKKKMDPEDLATDSKFSQEDQETLKNIAKTTASQVLMGEGLGSLTSLIKSEELQDLAIKKIVDSFKKR